MTNAYSNREFLDRITIPVTKPDQSFIDFPCENLVNLKLLFISAFFYHYINFFLERIS